MIDVHDLTFRYPGPADPALRSVTFRVEAGEIFGFLGPSGAGKSTTQRVLIGLLHGYSGRVEVLGRAPAAHGRAFYERIGVSFEVPNIYSRLTGRENLEFFGSLYDGPHADPAELLALVGLEAAADQRTEAYSKGMRMRLNFCRALLRSPELLFLDEPTNGQDPQNARRVKDIIRARRDAGCTVFLTTHDMSVAAELCDRVAFIVDGTLVRVDSPRRLMIEHGRRRVRVEHMTDGGAATDEFDLDGLGGNSAFQEVLRRDRIVSLHSLDATLEDVFLALTGRTLR